MDMFNIQPLAGEYFVHFRADLNHYQYQEFSQFYKQLLITEIMSRQPPPKPMLGTAYTIYYVNI